MPKSSSFKVPGVISFLIALVFFGLEITGLYSSYNFMQQTLAPVQRGIILFQDGTNSSSGSGSYGKPIVSTEICYPRSNNDLVNMLGLWYQVYLYFYIATVIFFIAAVVKSCYAGFRGVESAFSRPYQSITQGLPGYNKGLVLLIRLVTGKSNWTNFTEYENEQVSSYDEAASTYSAYLTSYVPLFLTAFYLLGCGPKRLLGNFPTLLSYIISVLLIIPKLPRVKKILGSSNVFNPTGGGGCTSYLSLGIGLTIIALPIILLIFNIEL